MVVRTHDDETNAQGAALRSSHGRALFPVGTEVRLTLVRALESKRDPSGEPAGGILIDPLVAGRPIRLEVEPGRFFVTSSVRGLEQLGRDAVQVVTSNSVYRVDRARAGAPTRPPDRSLKRARLRALRHLARRISLERRSRIRAPASPEDTHALDLADEATGYVAVLSQPKNADDPFAPGTRVRIARTRRGEREDLGLGHMLDAVELGQPVRCSTDDGAVFVTTAVCAVLAARPGAIDFETANTTYHLERLARDPAGAPRR